MQNSEAAVTAPSPMRRSCWGATFGLCWSPRRQSFRAAALDALAELVRTASRWRTDVTRTPTAAAEHALRGLARRHQDLSEEIRDPDSHLTRSVSRPCSSYGQ